jgi:L-lactate utilization protein LutC
MEQDEEEEIIIMRELEWAETAMEEYKRKNGKVPIRSTIHAPNVNSAEWKKDSMTVVISGSNSSSRLGGSLRGRNNNKDTTTNAEDQR